MDPFLFFLFFFSSLFRVECSVNVFFCVCGFFYSASGVRWFLCCHVSMSSGTVLMREKAVVNYVFPSQVGSKEKMEQGIYLRAQEETICPLVGSSFFFFQFVNANIPTSAPPHPLHASCGFAMIATIWRSQHPATIT